MHKTCFAILLLVVVCLAPPAAALSQAATPLNTAAIDAAVKSQMEKHGLPGVALAITQGNQLVYQRGYGSAGPGRAMTAQTPLYIGSQSKSFTGLAVAQLVVEGKLQLNAPVQRYLPWFKVADPQASQEITVNDLLHHISGLSDAGYTNELPTDTRLEDAVRSLSSAQLTAPMGKQFQYFNMGYSVLMLIVETVSGQPFAGYLQQHIFDPLQMKHTYSDPALASANGLAQGYGRLFGFAVPVKQPHRAYELGAGYIMASAEDLAHFAIALNNQGAYQQARILPADKVSLLFSPIQGYGMGWFISPQHYSHGGANEAFRTYVDLYPQRNLGIVLLVNEGSLLIHYVGGQQLFSAVEAAVLNNPAPNAGAGWSIRVIGWGMLTLLIGLVCLHTSNIRQLTTWAARARRMPAGRQSFDVAISFIIPTVILAIAYTQVQAFLGDRFNLAYQLQVMYHALPEPSLLLIVSTLPDYFQGILKLVWMLQGKTRPMQELATADE